MIIKHILFIILTVISFNNVFAQEYRKDKDMLKLMNIDTLKDTLINTLKIQSHKQSTIAYINGKSYREDSEMFYEITIQGNSCFINNKTLSRNVRYNIKSRKYIHKSLYYLDFGSADLTFQYDMYGNIVGMYYQLKIGGNGNIYFYISNGKSHKL